VKHRQSGYLVNDVKRWRAYLIKLYQNPEQILRMSKMARQVARLWTTEANARDVETAYLRSGPVGAASSTSRMPTLDEPSPIGPEQSSTE
jgi:hypothetical protein